MNFIRALEKLPGYLKEAVQNCRMAKKKLPVIEEAVKGSQTERIQDGLAAIERKIQL